MASMLSFAVYAGDNLPLATAASGTNGSIQVSEHGVDTSNEIQQARVIQGTVLEEGTNEPLIGVNVVVKGTTIGTTTDVEGKYSIRIPSDNAVLVFSYIGQKTEEYSVKGLKSLDVIMKSDATMLSEVVVYTGYMTQKKADLTGSVALADSKDIKKTSANVMKAMQGKMAGVKISNNGGNPAEDIGIQIRGLSSLSGAVTPLIVLDGMPAEGLNLRDINSGDIESIQVLKDAASASIYGARASGGVILVQTKKGKAGKTTIDYNGSVSVSSIINRPEMMNATEWGTAAFRAAAYDEWAYGSGLLLPNGFEYEYHRGDNGMLVLDNMKMKEYLDNNQLVKATDTNWMDEIFRTAVSTNHQLTISNGSDKAKSLFSLGYTNNQGTQIYSFFKQYSVRANTEYSLIKDRLKVGENLAISYLQYKSQWETFLAMIMPPMVPVYDVNGNWAGPAGLDDFDNPVRKMTMGKDNINNYVKIIGNVFADLNIWNGISARTQFGINYGNSYSRTVDGAYVETGFRGNDKNYVRNNQSHPLNYVWTNTLSYNKSFGKHHIDAVFGSEFTRYVQEGFYASREGLYLEDRDFAGLSVATGDEIDVSSSADEYTYFSLFAKANYSYAGKYLLSATVRRDGSSLFGVNNRYGVFPAFSAGWRIKDETFMEDADWLSDLKIRFSWGTNGSVQGLPRGYTTTPFTTNYFDTAYPIKGQETGALQSGYRRTGLVVWKLFSEYIGHNCFYSEKDGRPDTYVITGDIDAMWLRDSSAQVYPYLDFMSEDKNLQKLIIGVINKQTSFILKDPYANAFYDDDTKYTRWNSDHTEMKPGIHERKYELDSLCYPIRLAYGYWKKTNDTAPFDVQWKKAIETILRVCKEQQRKDGNGPYSFRRTSEWAIDAVPMGGVGYKVNPVGLICSTFRPSDDATIFPFLVPSNFFAVASLRQASEMVQKITKDNVLADELLALSKEVYNALQTYAVVNHPKFGKIYAFEIDGFGSAYLSDDANVPNLLALPYLGGVDRNDAIYANTRRFVWSEYNPYFFKGSYFEGIGGHHIGTDMIWPMSLIMKALTAQDDEELRRCIQMLQKTHAGTGFMHESFHKDDPKKFTRSWFAWANTLFGELLWKTFNEKPYLLEY